MEVRKCTHCSRKPQPADQFLKKDGTYYSQCFKCRAEKHKSHGTAKRRLRDTKSNCKRNNVEFALSKEEAFSFFEAECTYCKHYDAANCNGIDRLDARQGYLLNNCVTCCRVCNLLKQQMDPKSFIDHCKKISRCEYVFPDNIPICKLPMSNLKDETV